MKSRHLTKKYKHKSRSRSRRRKTRRRVLKGGVRPSSVRPSGRPSVRPSVRPSDRPSGGISKPPSTHMLVNKFFKHLKYAEFDKALCELYNLYNSLPPPEINEIMLSTSFKTKYEDEFYTKVFNTNYDGTINCNIHANRKYIIFLSYIFKKLIHGGYIVCNGKPQYFVYSKDKSRIRILTVLKRFLGYLDTACVNTTSYTITKTRYDEILEGTATGVTDGELAIYEIVSYVYTLMPLYPSLNHIIDNITTTDEAGNIVSYHMNTTVISRIIKQSYTDFLEDIPEEY